MVHQTPLRSQDRVWQRDAAGDNAPPRALSPASSAPYVMIPDALILAFAHDPLTVGIYAAIARLAVITRGAIPLAARDLAAWMGSARDADRAAIMRRILRLADAGWVLVERRRIQKHRLLPTWGQDQHGALRGWRFDSADGGRPSSLRGRRVPLALFDVYLGRLDPQEGPRRALVCRYFTRSLLDLTDIGAYIIGLRVETPPTARLHQLGLYRADRLVPPEDAGTLLARAAAGTLSTLEQETPVVVGLSVHGLLRLGLTPDSSHDAAARPQPANGSADRSPPGSVHGSGGGSVADADQLPALAHCDAEDAAGSDAATLIAWDVGTCHESITHDSPAMHAVGGADTIEDVPAAGMGAADCATLAAPQSLSGDQPLADLDAAVLAAHRALNPCRAIMPGEWHELLMLQQDVGASQLQIWQARALRASVRRRLGVTPDYYRACITDPRQPIPANAPPDTVNCRTQPSAADTVPSSAPPTVMDDRCVALLRRMGVRAPHSLADVPYELVAAWDAALTHPGMVMHFASPAGFAVSQMRQGHAPPSPDELDRWATDGSGHGHEALRHLPPMPPATGGTEATLEARVRAIAPPNASLSDLCTIAALLEDGVADADVRSRFMARYAGGAS